MCPNDRIEQELTFVQVLDNPLAELLVRAGPRDEQLDLVLENETEQTRLLLLV